MSRHWPSRTALHIADVRASRTGLWYRESVSVKFVIQPNTPPLHAPGASQSECVTPFHRFEKRFALAGDKWVNNEPNLIDESGVEQACDRAGTADQIDMPPGARARARLAS